MLKVTLALLVGLAGLVSGPAFAQEAAVSTAPSLDVNYILNTLLFLVGGFLVMWMAAGFAMLEAGLVRTKNVSMQSMKNISLYALAGIMYWLIGYNLMYTHVDGGFFGSFSLFYSLDPVALDGADTAALLDQGYSTGSDWFFQMVFVATAASVVSGTMAERVKLWPFMLFTALLTAFIYPIAGSWQWGGGWLNPSVPEGFDSWADAIAAGKEAVGVVAITGTTFSDFAGSTLVHSVGGWAALAGALLLGARKGKYSSSGAVMPMPASNIPMATLGTFILWLGWFGFNGASQLAMGTIENVSDVSRIFANTNMAAAGGTVTAMVLLQILYKKVDVTMVLNGALAGLVAITAEPLFPTIGQSIFIGAVGAVIVIVAVPILDKLKIDDVVGAIPVHLCTGIWGTMIVPMTNPNTSYLTQLIGVLSYAAFVLVCSFVVWGIMKYTIGIRVSEEGEIMGMDRAEVGVEAYPEFGTGSQRV